MKYRDAKHLHNGDQVQLKGTGEFLIVSDIEILGSLKIVRINCIASDGSKIVIYNNDVDGFHIF